jgi:hypothetical protein
MKHSAGHRLCRSQATMAITRRTCSSDAGQHHAQSPVPSARCPLPPQDDAELEVEGYLRRKYEGRIKDVEVVVRDDLDQVRGRQATGTATNPTLQPSCQPLLSHRSQLAHSYSPADYLTLLLLPPYSATTCRGCSASCSSSASGACSS